VLLLLLLVALAPCALLLLLLVALAKFVLPLLLLLLPTPAA
jgi:hypothetical protein